MIEKGKIVYHDQVIFGDNQIDNKKNRPCIVLFSIDTKEKSYVCTCPLTSQVRSFNKDSRRKKFIPEQIYHYKKLNFAKLDSVRLYPIEEIHETCYSISDECVEYIINSILNMKLSIKEKRLNIIKQLLQYEKLFIELEQREINHQKRLNKNEKRRNSKNFNKICSE